MSLFATNHARDLMFEMLTSSSGLSIASGNGTYEQRSQEYSQRFWRLESYIAGLELGARCAYDALVAEAKAGIAHRCRSAALGLSRNDVVDRADVHRIREAARRAREIVAAFREAA